MSTQSIAEVQERLPELIDRVARGETITITLEGRPVAELRQFVSEATPQPGAWRLTESELAWLDEFRRGLPVARESAGDAVSRMRDEDWQ